MGKWLSQLLQLLPFTIYPSNIGYKRYLKKYNKLSNALDKDVRKNYKGFFDGIKESSPNYQKAVLKK